MNTKIAAGNRRVLKRLSWQDRERLITEQKASGKTRQVFCMERGINLGTFYGWVKVVNKRRFTKVEVVERKAAPIEIELPWGGRIGIHLNGNCEELIRLFRGVMAC